MSTAPAGSDPDSTITVELTRPEAVAIANVLFMSLRPNNVRPPFDTFAEVEAMEDGYQKIATPISDLQGCRCARCDQPWTETMNAWDSIGDPETGELELVCQDCIAPEERAMFIRTPPASREIRDPALRHALVEDRTAPDFESVTRPK